jgi:hypothetical protein
MHTRRAIVLGGSLLAGACGVEGPTGPAPSPSFKAEVVTLFKGWFPLTPPPGGVYNVCTEEYMLMSGDYNLTVRMVTSSAGQSHFRVHSQANVKGVGATTGVEYVSLDLLNLEEKAGAKGAAVFHMQYPIRWVAKGRPPNVSGHIAVHVTVNANGTVTVNREEFVFDDCQ